MFCEAHSGPVAVGSTTHPAAQRLRKCVPAEVRVRHRILHHYLIREIKLWKYSLADSPVSGPNSPSGSAVGVGARATELDAWT